MQKLTIYRDEEVLAHVGTDVANTIYNGGLMNMNKVNSSFQTAEYIDFKEKDYIIHNSHIYELKDVPEHSETEIQSFSAEFLGIEYRLFDWLFFSSDGRITWDFFGTANDMLALVMATCNINDTGWVLADCDDSTPMLITFDQDNCRTAVSKIAEAFKLEYVFTGKSLTMTKTVGGYNHDLLFERGKGKGLYSLTKSSIDNANWGTVFYGFGSSDNLPADYKDGKNELTVDPVSNFTYTSRIKQRVVKFPDIKPEYTGTATVVTETSISDSGLNFNLNDYMVDGGAKIIFTSGDLDGQTFEIQKFNSSTKTITFKPNTDSTGFISPNSISKPEIGNQFKLVGIAMPFEYIDDAESRLSTALSEYASLNYSPKFAFGLNIVPAYLLRKGYVNPINPGDKVGAKYLGNIIILRVTEISYPIFLPQDIKATISNDIQYSLAAQIKKDIVSQKVEVSQLKRESLRIQAANSIRRRELEDATFDVDGDFRPDKIKAGSIEAQKLSSGARSQDFALSTQFKPNFNADPNAVVWSAGTLTHFTIADTVKAFSITSGFISSLSPSTLYYVYAKCLRSGTSGEIVIETAQRRVADDPTYYYFLIGVAHTVIDGVRAISLTYGYSDINGRFISTGRITSSDGLTWFDLDTGEISGVIKFRNSTGGLTNVGDIDDSLGGLISSGETIIEAGKIKTVRIDTDNLFVGNSTDGWIINKDTIKSKTTISGQPTTELKQDGTFVGRSVNVSGSITATSGSFGNILIESDRIRSANNKITITDAGILTAVDAHITGTIYADSGVISGDVIAGTLDAAYLNIINVNADNIASGTISTDRLDASSVKTSIVQTTDLSASKIVTGTLDASTVTLVNLSASSINTGTLNASVVSVINFSASSITTGTLDAYSVNVINLNANNITSGTIDASRINVDGISAVNVNMSGEFISGDISGAYAQMTSSGITFNNGSNSVYMGVGSGGNGFYAGPTGMYDGGLTTTGNILSYLAGQFTTMGSEGITTTGTYNAIYGGTQFTGQTFDANFGGGKTMKVVAGLIVESTGF